MIEIIVLIITFFVCLFLSIVFHEMGHLFYMQKLYPNTNIKINTYYNSIRDMGFSVGKQEDYDKMTNKQYFMTNFAGVSSGLLFIVLATILYNPYLSYLIIPYLFGSFRDIKEMIKAWKEGF